MVEICIIDYGMGNLRSIQKGLEKAGAKAVLTSKVADVKNAGAIVLPGVGAFEDAIKNLKNGGFVDVIREKISQGTPFLGVCLGLQLLFESSTEGGHFDGLKILPGIVDRFPASLKVKVPHMGWNTLIYKDPGHFLLEGIPDGTYMYFVHSFHPITNPENIVATAIHGHEFACIVKNKAGNLVATQFHPEKSSSAGIKMLENFHKFCQR
ncbi:MAG: imidazole glycerol phosphate synthase subunit HisH [Candidatus Sigynarchaeota archaeon]